MGQRLVVTINNEGRAIAAIYYHWSAYTTSALAETQRIIHCIYNHKDETEKELLFRLVRFCEANGGGIDGKDEERKYIQSMFPNETFRQGGYSRNDGLIALSPNGIKEMQGWSEGDVDIDLSDDSVGFGVYCGYENVDEFIENRKDWDEDFDESELDNCPTVDCSLWHFDASEIDHIVAEFDMAIRKGCPGYVKARDEIIELTE